MKIFVSSAEVEKSWRQRKSGRVEDFILMGTSLTARRFIFVPAVDSGGQAEPWTAVRGHRRSTSGQRVKFRVVKRERGERTTSSGSFLFTASTFDSCFPNFTSHQLWMLWMVLPKTLKRLHAHEHLLAFHCAQQHINLHMYVFSGLMHWIDQTPGGLMLVWVCLGLFRPDKPNREISSSAQHRLIAIGSLWLIWASLLFWIDGGSPPRTPSLYCIFVCGRFSSCNSWGCTANYDGLTDAVSQIWGW